MKNADDLSFDEETGPKFALTVTLGDGTTMQLGFPYRSDEEMLRGLASLLGKPLDDVLKLTSFLVPAELQERLRREEATRQ